MVKSVVWVSQPCEVLCYRTLAKEENVVVATHSIFGICGDSARPGGRPQGILGLLDLSGPDGCKRCSVFIGDVEFLPVNSFPGRPSIARHSRDVV